MLKQPPPLAQAMAGLQILKRWINDMPGDRGKKKGIKNNGPGGVPLHQSLAYL